MRSLVTGIVALSVSTAIVEIALAATPSLDLAGQYLAQVGAVPSGGEGMARSIGRDNPQHYSEIPGHLGATPIYNGFDHQPTEYELRALHEQDVNRNQAREVDRLYDELMSDGDKPAKPRRARTH
jgi:hypothetical protein